MTILPRRFSHVAAVAAAIVAMTSAPLSAAQTPEAQSYLITSVIAGPTGPVATTEVLNVSAAGELSAPPTDPAVACFLAAQSVIADNARPSQNGTAIAVGFNGNDVTIPLRMTSADLHNGLEGIAVNGSVEGSFDKLPDQTIAIVVQGNVIVRDRTLVGARFIEMSLFTATHAAIGQSMCTLARIVRPAIDATPAAPPVRT
jgi:hypothetical protein